MREPLKHYRGRVYCTQYVHERHFAYAATLIRTIKKNCKFELENSKAVTGHLESADLKGKLPPSAVYEDNAGCVILASDDDKYRARTKHINIKWHHFKDQVRIGAVKIIKVDTTLNWADTLTKPLSRVKLESLRKLIQGW